VQDATGGPTRSAVNSAHIHMPYPLETRVFKNWCVWDRWEGKGGRRGWVYAFCEADGSEPVDDAASDDFSTDHAFQPVIGLTRGVYLLEELAENVCEWTMVQEVDARGSLPKFILEMRTKELLGVVNECHLRWIREGTVVDREMREGYKERIKRGLGVNGSKIRHTGLVKQLTQYMGSQERLKWISIRGSGAGTDMQVMFPTAMTAVGRATAVVDCSAVTMLAWGRHWCSCENNRVAFEGVCKARMCIEDEECPYTAINISVFRIGRFFQDREFVLESIWQECESTPGRYMIR